MNTKEIKNVQVSALDGNLWFLDLTDGTFKAVSAAECAELLACHLGGEQAVKIMDGAKQEAEFAINNKSHNFGIDLVKRIPYDD